MGFIQRYKDRLFPITLKCSSEQDAKESHRDGQSHIADLHTGCTADVTQERVATTRRSACNTHIEVSGNTEWNASLGDVRSLGTKACRLNRGYAVGV